MRLAWHCLEFALRLDDQEDRSSHHLKSGFWDVIGRYLDPPKESVVPCCNEKSAYPPLERAARPDGVLRARGQRRQG